MRHELDLEAAPTTIGATIRDIEPDGTGVLDASLAPIGPARRSDTAGRVKRPPARRRSKRILDLILTSLIVLAVMPLMAVIALLVRLDGGPALFRQARIGRGGGRFTCLKFRTMVVDAEARLARILAEDPKARAEWDSRQKLSRDVRITRIGRFLRTTSLDELPQLFNVLRGDMSLVGPRPIVAEEIPRYGTLIDSYYHCRPGLTGPWQISGRSNTNYERRVRLDSDYAATATITGDLVILVKTFRVLLTRDGAY